MRKGCLWRPKNSKYIFSSCSVLCPESGEADQLIAAQQGFVWFISIIAFADGSKPEITEQAFEATVTLVQISVMSKTRKPTCVIVTWLFRVYFPGVQIEHLWPGAKACCISEQVSKYRVRELAKITTTSCWY